MSFDSFKSSTVGPEALAARIELEKRLREQRDRDRANRQRDKERRDYNLAVAAEDSKNYVMAEDAESGSSAPFVIPKLSRGKNDMPAIDKKFQVSSNSQNTQVEIPAQKTANGFKLKRF